MAEVDTPFPKLKLTVTKGEGVCYHGYKIGDEIILEDFTHAPKHFCLGLAHALFPVIYALSFGAKFGFRDNQRSLPRYAPLRRRLPQPFAVYCAKKGTKPII